MVEAIKALACLQRDLRASGWNCTVSIHLLDDSRVYVQADYLNHWHVRVFFDPYDPYESNYKSLLCALTDRFQRDLTK